MLENFSMTKVKQFNSLTDEELLEEKSIAESQWNYVQEVSALSPVVATAMMGKMEWYIGKILHEMKERDIEGGFKYEKPKKLKLVCKHRKIKSFILPNI